MLLKILSEWHFFFSSGENLRRACGWQNVEYEKKKWLPINQVYEMPKIALPTESHYVGLK